MVDPSRDTDRYLRFLEERGSTLSAIVETHIHADFASGAKALAEATGAELTLSAYDEGEYYQYGNIAVRRTSSWRLSRKRFVMIDGAV